MKKVFKLTHPKKKYARLVDSVRRDVKKYIQRERRRELPEGADFWDFDCKFGPTAETAENVHMAEIGKQIDAAEAQQLESFYIEILARPALRMINPYAAQKDENQDPES
ncbi:hypothetical protein Ga0123461_0478 [Mariprofundus aestuarium]|uniref:Uncharacterized protein n=1 Tax=Mariprofundus aestuarium TaxID=1921086 RepID=A0A2K8KVQ2_MARES|nr:DUF6172 family protein [Mariprofundus aestuarium]ATX78915.1 hypothetical protein Ga0123461_0478 [Mariprofundus aestuarium]